MFSKNLPKLFIISIFLFWGINLLPEVSGLAKDSWKNLSPGIDFQVFQLPDPNQVFVARMERENENVTLESGLALDRLAYGRETVRDIAKRYDDSLNYWGQEWGWRSKVIVAINGYYFNPEMGTPWRGQIQSGWYIKRFDNFQNGSGLVWKFDRDIFIGGCIFHPPSKQTISFENNQFLNFNGINQPREENQLIIYTSHYSDTTGTDNNGVEVLVEISHPLYLGTNSVPNIGTIKDIFDQKGSSFIPFDAVILSASGTARIELLKNIEIGQKIKISQRVVHYQHDCRTPNSNDWSNIYTGIGGDFVFLKEGETQSFDIGAANVRAPRTAVAYNDQYIYFIVVDGHNPGVSVGMSMWELAEFSKSYLKAEYGISEDSGGSSTMVVKGKVVNNTFCNFNDCAALLAEKPSQTSVITDTIPQEFNSTPALITGYQTISESLVGNILMMANVYPPIKSKTLEVGDTTNTKTPTELFLGPGMNYPSRTIVPRFSNIKIIAPSKDINGIYSQNSFWWYVEYNGIEGWVEENNIFDGVQPTYFTFKPFDYDLKKR